MSHLYFIPSRIEILQVFDYFFFIFFGSFSTLFLTFSLPINFFPLLTEAIKWKNFVFLSFSFNDFILDCWIQYFYFILSHNHNCAVRAFSLAKLTSFKPCSSFIRPSFLISASSCSTFLSMSPKTSLFHFFNGIFSLFNLVCSGTFSSIFHSPSTILTKLGFENQTSKVRNGRGPQLIFSQSTWRGQ